MHMHTFTHAHIWFTCISDEIFHQISVLGAKKSSKSLFDSEFWAYCPSKNRKNKDLIGLNSLYSNKISLAGENLQGPLEEAQRDIIFVF